jgi:hypothetical protein
MTEITFALHYYSYCFRSIFLTSLETTENDHRGAKKELLK